MTSSKPKVYLTRIESFSAAHRLHSNQLSDEENVKLYDKCNNANGHGHNYKLEVTVRGHVNASNGMVMNISDMKVLIKQKVLDLLDHKSIDLDVEHFKSNKLPSTAENIALFIWSQLVDSLPSQVELHSVKLHETDKNIVEIKL